MSPASRPTEPERRTVSDLEYPPLDDEVDGGRERKVQSVAILMLVVLLWVAFAELTTYERRQALDSSAGRNANLLMALEQYTVRVLRNAEAVTHFVGTSFQRGSREQTSLRRLLSERAQNNDAFAEVLLLDTSGRLLATHRGESEVPQGQLPVPSGADTGRMLIGAPFDASAGRRMIPLMRPVLTEGGELLAWSVVLVDSRRLLGLLEGASLPEDTLVALVRSDASLLATWSSQGTARPRLDAASLARASAARPQHAPLVMDGRERQATVHGFREYPLRALVATATDDVLSDYRMRRNSYLWACITLSLLAAGLGAALWRLQRRRAEMAQGLSRARERLAELNAQLELQVAHRTQELEQANRDLEAFSYSVAHDLRAPLGAIDGFSQQLEPTIRSAGDEKTQRYLARVRANCRHMSDIIDGLLELARLGRKSLRREPVDLSALAAQVIANLQETQPDRRVSVTLQPGLVAQGDPALLRQVLENLLGNAWKYTGRVAVAQIELGCTTGEDGVPVFHVRDNGAGFDMAHAAQLFRPFRRLHGSAEFQGLGIGLALVERIVTLHGGHIRAESQPGSGATFSWTLAPAAR